MGASVRRGLVAALVRRRVATNLFCCFLFYLFVSFPPFWCLFFLFYLVYCSLKLLNVLIPVAKIYLSKWEIIFPDLPHWWLAKGGWWLLSRCHLSSPWNSLPIATNPCTTVPTLHLQIQRGNVGFVFFIFCLHLSGQYPPPPPTAKWVLENTGEALTTQHAQKAYMSPVGKATLWKLSNWWQTIMHPVYEYFGCYAPCIIWIVWISCTLYENILAI